jgi:hypothetical protein
MNRLQWNRDTHYRSVGRMIKRAGRCAIVAPRSSADRGPADKAFCSP